MKEEFCMKYKMIRRTPFLGNSDRSLVLRQHYAKVMFGLMQQQKRIINIDETWLPHTDFRSKRWCIRGDKNRMSIKEMSQRVNLIVALDNHGRVFASLTQTNTDSNVMLMFLSRLAQRLTEQEQDWRDNTVFVLDGASYHRS